MHQDKINSIGKSGFCEVCHVISVCKHVKYVIYVFLTLLSSNTQTQMLTLTDTQNPFALYLSTIAVQRGETTRRKAFILAEQC